jgi:hypothetical protein
MPLANLLERTVGIRARTVDDATASTQFDVDLGTASGVKLFCLVGHNFSVGATMRLRASDTVGVFTSPSYDSGNISVWGSAYLSSDVPWESDAFWDSVATFTGLDAGNPTLMHILATEIAARYWRCEISDTSNSDGYIEAGRLFLGPIWQPTYNMSLGAQIGYLDDSTVETAFGGSEFFDDRPVRRQVTIRFDELSDSEAWLQALDMQRLRGITRELFFSWDPDDQEYIMQRSFLARIEALNPIEAVRYRSNAMALRLRELI